MPIVRSSPTARDSAGRANSLRPRLRSTRGQGVVAVVPVVVLLPLFESEDISFDRDDTWLSSFFWFCSIWDKS